MKKLFLLVAAASISFGAFAQRSLNSSIMLSQYKPIMTGKAAPAAITERSAGHLASVERTTLSKTHSRWLDHLNYVDQALGGAISTQKLYVATPVWFDSTVTELFSGGVKAAVETGGVCEYQDPRSGIWADSAAFSADTTIQVTNSNSYVVDSVALSAIYSHIAGHNNKDTLIIGVQPQRYYVYYNSKNTWLHNNPNLPAADTNLDVFMPYYYDSVHHETLSDSTGIATTSDTIILDPVTMGEEIDPATGYYDSFNYYYRTFPINPSGKGGHVGCVVPAGFAYTVTVLFKSGDTWTPNVDSVNGLNDWRMAFAYQGSTSGSGWMENWYQNYNSLYVDTAKHDRDMSSILDTRGAGFGPDGWFTTYASQDFNNHETGFPDQYAFIQGHIVCQSCLTIRQIANGDTSTTDTTHHGGGTLVNNVNKVISSVSAYPNPANGTLYIPFSLGTTANVTISLSNTIGQVVSTQSMGNVASGKAEFDVTNLPAGIYFYTLQAGVERTSGRVTISK